MSLRENICIEHPMDIDAYFSILESQHGLRPHPAQADSFLVGDPGLPFYRPNPGEARVSILGFNYAQLPYELVEVLIEHPELAPDKAVVSWTQEQDLLLQSTLGELRAQARSYGVGERPDRPWPNPMHA